jgi:membrane fusion protein (multidrug efflux system)
MLGDEIVVLAGLSAGEQVAASGSFKLREGVLVTAAGNQDRQPAQDQLLSQR